MRPMKMWGMSMATRIDVYVVMLVAGLLLTMTFIAICSIKLFVRGKRDMDYEQDKGEKKEKNEE